MNEIREGKTAAAKARLDELAVRFLDRTAGDIATMRDCLAKMALGDLDSLAELRHLAHRMVGTGATLGFESLSERALRIEGFTDGCAPGHVPDDQKRQQISAALDALQAELRQQHGT